MNWRIYAMSMRQNRKGFAIWMVVIAALVVLGMAFYPPISESIGQMTTLFENPMMKSLIGLFMVGPEALGSLTGFYITYASIYVILMGGIFATLSAVGDVAGEFRDHTAEFIFTKPVKRSSILISKWLAIETRIFILCIVLCITTLFSFMLFSKTAPYEYYAKEDALETVSNAVQQRPQVLSEVFELNADFFEGWVMAQVETQLEENKAAVEEIDLSPDEMRAMLEALLQDSDTYFEEVLKNPDQLMDQFGIAPAGREAFLKSVEKERISYEAMMKRYENDPDFHLEMFLSAPDYFLKKIRTGDRLKTMQGAYPEATDALAKLIAPYSARRIALLHFYMFLFMSVMNSLGVFLSAIMRRPKGVMATTMGLVLALYFFSTVSRISTETAKFAVVSPFGLIDQNITGAVYQLSPLNVILLIAEAVILLGVSINILNTRNI